MDYRSRLLTLANAFRAARGVSLSRVSTLVRNDGKFFDSLESGKGCTVDTYEAAIQWFSDHWPDELEWPPIGVDRPAPRPVTPSSDRAA